MRLSQLAACLLWLTAHDASGAELPASEKNEPGNIRTPTVEEQRIPSACPVLIELNCDNQSQQSGWDLSGLTKLATKQAIEQARTRGTRLWRAGQQTSGAKTPDDRWLYWQRLRTLKQYRSVCALEQCSKVIDVFERASRGIDDLHFSHQISDQSAQSIHNAAIEPDAKTPLRIIITGFDPFSLDANVDQSNPSGAAALAVDGLTLTHRGVTATIESMVFPVRFADFDQGIIEDTFTPLLETHAFDALITISMGRANFDLERFPGRRRSATAAGNLRIKSGASQDNPLVPLLNNAPLKGAEFVEFNLPVPALQSVNSPFKVNDNRQVRTLERGTFAATSLAELATQTAVSGSGGGYLSNEISYRTVRLVQQQQPLIPVGHIHTPRISGNDPHAVHVITGQLRAMLEAALPDLEKTRWRQGPLTK